jgi:hypothetical protein
MLQDMIGVCPKCKQALIGHAWATLAEAGNPSDVSKLFLFLEAKDWENLHAIQSFDATKNAIIVIALQCKDVAGSTLPYVDYAELYSASERGEFCVLTELQWLGLNQALPGLDWHSF